MLLRFAVDGSSYCPGALPADIQGRCIMYKLSVTFFQSSYAVMSANLHNPFKESNYSVM